MKKFLLSSIVILLTLPMMAQTPASLKLNLEKNKVYRLKSVSEQTIIQTVNGNQQTVQTKSDYIVSLKVVDATGDFMVTEVRFDTIITNTNTMGKATNISSASEGNIKSTEMTDVMSCIMNRLSRNALYVKMDYAGQVIEILNSKMLSDIIMKDTSSITLAGPIKSAVKKQIEGTVSDKSLKTLVEMFTHNLPGKQIATGDTWEVTVSTNSGGMALDIVTTYHLDGVNGNSANITAESTIKAAANADPIESGGAKVTYDDLKGLSKSSLVIDTRTGLIVENKAKTHIAGNLGISAPGFSMQIPMDINSESKVISLQ